MPRKPRLTTTCRGLGTHVLGQDRHLFQLLVQRVAVVGFARAAACTHHQALPVRERYADLVAELLGALQVQHAGPQADGKARAPFSGDTSAGELQRRAEEISCSSCRPACARRAKQGASAVSI